METHNKYYHYKGKKEDIINSILSLLLGKEYYQEVSFYHSFINDSQTPKYRKKIEAILNLMQKENLILIRENSELSDSKHSGLFENTNEKEIFVPDADSRIYIRQHGKQVLSEGGYKEFLKKNNNSLAKPETMSSLSTKLAVFFFFTSSILWCL